MASVARIASSFIWPSFDLLSTSFGPHLAFIQLPAFDVYRQGNDWVMVVLIFLSSFFVFYLLLFYTVTQRYPSVPLSPLKLMVVPASGLCTLSFAAFLEEDS